MFRRLKRLWELSATEDSTSVWLPTSNYPETLTSTRRLATIVQDDPMDLFPNEEENVETSEQTSTDRTD